MSSSASSAFRFSIDSAHEQASIPTQAYVPNHPLHAPIPDPLPTTAPLLELQSPNPSPNLPSCKAAFHTSASRMQCLAPVLKLPDCKTSSDDDGREPDEHMAQSQSLFDSLQDELSKMRARLASLATSMVSSSLSSTTTGHTTSAVFTPTSGSTTKVALAPSSLCAAATSSASSDRFQVDSTNTASVTPQVFGEMPTPIYEEETHSTASELCSGQHVLIQNSGVNKLSEQSLDGRPHQYGLHNLNCLSVFRADGTEQSSYTLPESYPCEQAISAPVFDVYYDESNGCSNEFVQVFPTTPEQMSAVNGENSEGDSTGFVDVFVSTLGQQKYEEHQQETEHLLRDFSKVPESEQTSANMLDYTFEQQQQNDEKPSANAQQLRDPQLNALVIHETRTAWDPGASIILVSPVCNAPLLDIPRAKPPEKHGSSDSSLHGILLQALKTENSVEQTAYLQWNPGDHTNLSSKLNKNIFGVLTRVPQQICYYRVPSSLDSHGIKFLWDPGILVPNRALSRQTPCTLLILIGQPVDLNKFWAQLLHCHTWCHTPNDLLQLQYCLLPILFPTAASATKLCTDASKSMMVQILVVQSRPRKASVFEPTTMSSYTFELAWTEVNEAAVYVVVVPCSKGKPVAKNSMFLSTGDTSMKSYYFPKLFMQLLCTARTVQVTEQRHLLEFHLMDKILQHGSDFRDGQLGYLPQVTRATEKHLSWLPIPELTKWQSQVTGASFVWDPGTMLLGYKSKWWLRFIEEKINWYNNIKCYIVALWLIHFQPP